MIGKITKISGPLIVAENMKESKMYDVVRVGKEKLIGEIIELRDDKASIQVYEETSGLSAGEEVVSTNEPLSVELAPGLIGSIYDGIQRPLQDIYKKYGDNIERGMEINNLSRELLWDFIPVKAKGDHVKAGDIIGIVNETEIIEHRIMVPYGIEGEIADIKRGMFTIVDTICKIKTKNGIKQISMLQKWPVRKGRPYQTKFSPDRPLITGQRVIDTLFPIAKGGVAAVPGPFGSGKTVVQHQLAKWADAEIVVYIGCGERGNEMTDVLNEFPELKDPKSGYPLMRRTILIANTSDMPVSAREASIYSGITIAEYYRDMGYNVAIMADSTSRWAEALREMSGRLEEMPGEEGYPAYLSSRLAEFYERAGIVQVLGTEKRMGSITAIGAVSPQGGDLSEPVSQATLRIVKVFWGLSSQLAYRRHFPAIDWLVSYSLYNDKLKEWYDDNVSEKFIEYKAFVTKMLQEEAELQEIVSLVGIDSLGSVDRLKLETAKSIREDFLHQNAFDSIDTYTSLKKQFKMLELIYNFHTLSLEKIEKGAKIHDIFSLKVREKIGRAKSIKESDIKEFDDINNEIKKELNKLA